MENDDVTHRRRRDGTRFLDDLCLYGWNICVLYSVCILLCYWANVFNTNQWPQSAWNLINSMNGDRHNWMHTANTVYSIDILLNKLIENEMQFCGSSQVSRINNKYGEPLSLICDENFSLYSTVVRFLLGRQIIGILSYEYLQLHQLGMFNIIMGYVRKVNIVRAFRQSDRKSVRGSAQSP